MGTMNALEPNKTTMSIILRLLIPFATGYLLADLYRSVNAVLSPVLIEEFQLNASHLGLITSAYFLGFAALQIPLGVALDRFGARRTLACALLFAALGSLLYGIAESAQFLIIGRFLIGFGMGGCLMGAYKAYSEWIATDRLPLINSIHTFIGGFGVVLATEPVHFSLNFLDWRELFFVLSVLTVLTSAFILFVVPRKKKEGNTNETILNQFKGISVILKSKAFWCLLPIATFVQATYLSLDTLWAGPWFIDVAGFSDSLMARLLLIIALSLTAGYLLNGVVADWLRKFQIKAIAVAVFGMVTFTILVGILAMVSLTGGTGGVVLWPLLIFFGPFVLLCYPIFASMFDKGLSGRVITLYNLAVFLTSFIFQWFTGVVIDLWPHLADGGYNPLGYAAAFFIIFGLHAVSLLWLFSRRKHMNNQLNAGEESLKTAQ